MDMQINNGIHPKEKIVNTYKINSDSEIVKIKYVKQFFFIIMKKNLLRKNYLSRLL